MKIVVDTNILFSYFWKDSLTKKILLIPDFELISPELVLKELEKYSIEIMNKTKISEKEFNEELKKLKSIVSFINKKEYSYLIKEVEDISPDKDDADFLALCLKYSCFLWSKDSLLKSQDKINILSTEDIIDLIFG